MRTHVRSIMLRASLFGLIFLSVVNCMTDPLQPTDTAEEELDSCPLPGNLSLSLYAKTTVTINQLSKVRLGDVASSGPAGSVLFDKFSLQDTDRNVLANKVTVGQAVSIGNVIANDLICNGRVASICLGFDATLLPAGAYVTALCGASRRARL